MSNVNFKSLDITTVTAIVYLEGKIYVNPAFFLMEMYRIGNHTECNISSKKSKLPLMDAPGRVLSLTASFDDKTLFVRGIQRSKSLKNAKTIDISVTGKNVNLKLYENQIHMCGVTSRNMAIEAGNIIIQKINQVQDMLEYIKDHPVEMDSTIEWVREKTLGPEEFVEDGTTNIVNRENIFPLTPEMTEILMSEAIVEAEEMASMNSEDNLENKVINISKLSSQQYIPSNDLIVNIIDDDDDEPTDSDNIEINGCRPFNISKPEINPNIVGYIPSVNQRGWTCVEKVNYIIFPEEFISQGYHSTYSKRPIDCYPEGVDGRIANLLLDLAIDYQRHDLYSAQLGWISTIENVIDNFDRFQDINNVHHQDGEENDVEQISDQGDSEQYDIPNYYPQPNNEYAFKSPIKIINVKTSMTNYNYNIGFNLINNDVADYIRDVCGFVPVYVNTFDHSVKIYLPYDIPDYLKDSIKIERKTKHSFMLYKTGSVTQSSSHEILAREAYILFNRVIQAIRPFIEDVNVDTTIIKIKSIDDIINTAKTMNNIDLIKNGTVTIIPKNKSPTPNITSNYGSSAR